MEGGTSVSDVFSGSSSGYDPERVYTASRNEKGFTSQLRVKVQPTVLDEYGAIIASKVIPEYRTFGDVVRNALTHQMYRDAQLANSPRFTAFVTEYISEAELDTSLMIEDRRNGFVEKARKLVGAANLDSNLRPTAIEQITKFRDVLPVGSSQREQLSMILGGIVA